MKSVLARKLQIILLCFAGTFSNGYAQESDFFIFESAPTPDQLLQIFGGSPSGDLERIVRVDGDQKSITDRLDNPRKAPSSFKSNVSPPDDGFWKWVPTHVNFALNSSRIESSSHDIIDIMGRALRQDTSLSIVISGHADARGSHGVNDPLSLNRAAAVKSYLASKFGIAPERLVLRWRGEREPFPGLDPFDPLNRRVQFGQRQVETVRPAEAESETESDQQAVKDLLDLLRKNQADE